MQEQNDLGTEVVDSPSTTEANVNESENQTVYDQFWDKNDDVHATSEESPEEPEQTDPVETVVSQNEGTADESSDSTVEQAVEADKPTNEDEIDHVEKEQEVELEHKEVVDYNELKNYDLEFNGERYSPEDIKSILGQEKAAGTKSREASEALKDIEAQYDDLAKREEAFTQRNDAAIASDQMVRIQSEARQVNAKLQKARADGDAFEITMAKDRLDELKDNFKGAKEEVDKQNYEDQQNQIISAEKGYADRGLSYLNKDGPAATAFTSYLNANLTKQQSHAVIMTPSFGEMAEKARKWDAAQGKEGVKLKTSDKTLKAGSGEPVSSKKSNEEIARKQRMAAGRGTKADIKQASSNAAKGFWDN